MKIAIIGLLSAYSTFTFAEFDYNSIKLAPYERVAPKEIYKSTKIRKSLMAPVMDFTANQTVVKNQGQRGACAYFSTTAMLESAIKKNQDEDVNISEELLIRIGKGNLQQGQYSDGSNALLNINNFKYGLGLENQFPYQPSWFDKGLPCEGIEEGSFEAINNGCHSHFGATEEDVKKLIPLDYNINTLYTDFEENMSDKIMKIMSAHSTAVVVNVPVNFNGWDTLTGHSYHNEDLAKQCIQTPSVCGGHSILLVGYDSIEKVFKFKNSWGSDWGLNGYGNITFDTINQYGTGTPYFVEMNEVVDLPENHAQASIAEMIDPNAFINFDEEMNLQVSVTGRINYVKDQVIYMSTFISDSSEMELMQSPEHLAEEYGHYIRGSHYSFMDGETHEFTNESPAKMNIEGFLLSELDFITGKLKLRISSYFHNDTQGWSVLYREFIPVTL